MITSASGSVRPVLNKVSSLDLLPPTMSELVVRLNKDGFTTELAYQLAENSASIAVDVNNQDQVLAAVDILHAVQLGLNENQRSGFEKVMGQSNQPLQSLYHRKYS